MNHFRTRVDAGVRTALLVLCLAVVSSSFIACSDDSNNPPPTTFERTDLVSDIPDAAHFTDPNLVNAWGIAASATGPFWVADNGTSVSTLYNGDGAPFPLASPLVVSIPAPEASSGAGEGEGSLPTGIVFNGTIDFVVTQGDVSGPALFIFDTEAGTIAGWNPTVNPTNAITVSDDEDAIYKGLAIGKNGSANFIYTTNFFLGEVEVYDKDFAEVDLGGAFDDPNIPEGFAPFGIQNVGGNLYVTYAKQDANHEDDVAGPGNGYVDEFDTDGNLIRRFASQGTLNSPWGLALAPSSFGTFAGALLVGNFGDGRINAFNVSSGAFLGQLGNTGGNAVTVPGLWGLIVGNGMAGGDSDTIYFTAGPDGEEHGLFGSVRPSGS